MIENFYRRPRAGDTEVKGTANLPKHSAIETPGVGSRKSKQWIRAVDPEPLVNTNERCLIVSASKRHKSRSQGAPFTPMLLTGSGNPARSGLERLD